MNGSVGDIAVDQYAMTQQKMAPFGRIYMTWNLQFCAILQQDYI
jgi:hypothetical protein